MNNINQLITNKYNINFLLYILLGLLIGLFSIILTNFMYVSFKAFLLGLTIILFSIVLINKRSKQFGLADPLLIFLSFFAAYNGLILIQFAFEFNKDLLISKIYPLTFKSSTVIYAGYLGIIALVGLIIGEKLSELFIKRQKIQIFTEKEYVIKRNALLYTGIVMYCTGLMLFFLNYQRVGGFFHYISLQRGAGMTLLSQVRGSLPYSSFIFPGIAIVYYNFFNTKDKKILYISLLFLLLWIILMIIQGDRRYLAYSLIIIYGIWIIQKNIKVRINKKIVFYAIIIYICLTFFAQVRFLISPIMNNEMKIQDGITWITEHININWFLPGENEFAGPYFTLLYSIENRSKLLYGSSYVNSIANILPRSLYPGPKPPTIAQDFALFIHNSYMSNFPFVIGWGYSPVAEAYNNFGLFGIFIIFIIYGLILSFIRVFKRKGLFGILIYSMILPELMNFNRIDFSSILQELFFNIIGVFIAMLLYKILKEHSCNDLKWAKMS
ncbi:oligosaccharide repeat unit polymerase [Caldanaerobius fijiensis DSM 17918]|uniref:Oligosaccharide repeat unit polymerase n=1 Tax=Caldanaerobius fijiensis DSM 17918 TaxID=1121256 RepID=A0A1M5DYV2_9THEO|nr:O-antigen polysaccharide polymerase Wzy [Caldanaerobius fijiensis]SHF72125.1 oligosaccharide repeat unit polymerase [Caldanaerobius fijiensis DSM 17918]